MTLSKLHYIHLENGRFNAKTETSAADLDTLLDTCFAAPPPNGLLIHFHGGLVPMQRGKAIAEKLTKRFEPATHVVGFVWESGFFEATKNNLGEIAKEELFQRLLGKVVVWALKRWVPGAEGFKSAGAAGFKGVGAGGVVNEVAVEAEIRAWLADGTSPTGRPPYEDREGEDEADEEAPVAEPTEADPEIQMDVEADGALGNALGQVSNRQLATPEIATTKGGFVRGSATTLMDEDGLAKLREPAVAGEKGLLSMLKLAFYVTKIVFRVVRRLVKGRGHGLYTTAVEEILREFYVGAVGKVFFWDRMKQDTRDAFGTDPDCGGTAFLKRLAARVGAGQPAPQITLCGHSTGAIYVCHFLEAAAKWLPEVKFNVIFLAPAVTTELFGQTLDRHAGRIAHFRSFAMSDTLEKKDRLVPILYPRSLLYFVSGVVESKDSADVPLVGMKRYFSGQKPYTGKKMPGVDQVRGFLSVSPSAGVWSIATGSAGQESASANHGDFDDDAKTLDSIKHALAHGF